MKLGSVLATFGCKAIFKNKSSKLQIQTLRILQLFTTDQNTDSETASEKCTVMFSLAFLKNIKYRNTNSQQWQKDNGHM